MGSPRSVIRMPVNSLVSSFCIYLIPVPVSLFCQVQYWASVLNRSVIPNYIHQPKETGLDLMVEGKTSGVITTSFLPMMLMC